MAKSIGRKAQQLTLDFSAAPREEATTKSTTTTKPSAIVHLGERRAKERLSAVRAALAKTGVFHMDSV
jgi:hypothetical protein